MLSSGGDAEDDDSDLIAVAFQELDLSAGALLYSTETTREDAWYTAVMAGLGEKAHMYTKVRVGRCTVERAACFQRGFSLMSVFLYS